MTSISTVVEKEGYLWVKRHPSVTPLRAWQWKYVVLKKCSGYQYNVCLEWYENREAFLADSSPKKLKFDMIKIVGNLEDKKKEFAFVIYTSTYDQLQLATKTESERVEWTDKFNQFTGKDKRSCSLPTASLDVTSKYVCKFPKPQTLPLNIDPSKTSYRVKFQDSTLNHGCLKIKTDYLLQVGPKHVSLWTMGIGQEPQRNILCWSMATIKSYYSRPVEGSPGMKILTIEAGRQSSTGSGDFHFLTPHGDEIKNNIRLNTKRTYFEKKKHSSDSLSTDTPTVFSSSPEGPSGKFMTSSSFRSLKSPDRPPIPYEEYDERPGEGSFATYIPHENGYIHVLTAQEDVDKFQRKGSRTSASSHEASISDDSPYIKVIGEEEAMVNDHPVYLEVLGEDDEMDAERQGERNGSIPEGAEASDTPNQEFSMKNRKAATTRFFSQTSSSPDCSSVSSDNDVFSRDRDASISDVFPEDLAKIAEFSHRMQLEKNNNGLVSLSEDHEHDHDSREENDTRDDTREEDDARDTREEHDTRDSREELHRQDTREAHDTRDSCKGLDVQDICVELETVEENDTRDSREGHDTRDTRVENDTRDSREGHDTRDTRVENDTRDTHEEQDESSTSTSEDGGSGNARESRDMSEDDEGDNADGVVRRNSLPRSSFSGVKKFERQRSFTTNDLQELLRKVSEQQEYFASEDFPAEKEPSSPDDPLGLDIKLQNAIMDQLTNPTAASSNSYPRPRRGSGRNSADIKYLCSECGWYKRSRKRSVWKKEKKCERCSRIIHREPKSPKKEKSPGLLSKLSRRRTVERGVSEDAPTRAESPRPEKAVPQPSFLKHLNTQQFSTHSHPTMDSKRCEIGLAPSPFHALTALSIAGESRTSRGSSSSTPAPSAAETAASSPHMLPPPKAPLTVTKSDGALHNSEHAVVPKPRREHSPPHGTLTKSLTCDSGKSPIPLTRVHSSPLRAEAEPKPPELLTTEARHSDEKNPRKLSGGNLPPLLEHSPESADPPAIPPRTREEPPPVPPRRSNPGSPARRADASKMLRTQTDPCSTTLTPPEFAPRLRAQTEPGIMEDYSPGDRTRRVVGASGDERPDTLNDTGNCGDNVEPSITPPPLPPRKTSIPLPSLLPRRASDESHRYNVEQSENPGAFEGPRLPENSSPSRQRAKPPLMTKRSLDAMRSFKARNELLSKSVDESDDADTS